MRVPVAQDLHARAPGFLEDLQLLSGRDREMLCRMVDILAEEHVLDEGFAFLIAIAGQEAAGLLGCMRACPLCHAVEIVAAQMEHASLLSRVRCHAAQGSRLAARSR